MHSTPGDYPDGGAREDVLAAYRAHLRAMVEGDTAALEELLGDEFTLTHITGYAQLKKEWLSQIRAGQFAYHDVEERTVEVAVGGSPSTRNDPHSLIGGARGCLEQRQRHERRQ